MEPMEDIVMEEASSPSSPPSKPARRFNPQPIETTAKSSRRFAPEPVETTVKSSRRFAPEPVETTARSTRRFAPEPVETTTKSTRRFAPEPVETTSKSSRRFVPQPVETTASSNRMHQPEQGTLKPRRKFNPQPVETSTKSTRQQKEAEQKDTTQVETESKSETKEPSKPKPRRRFAPQLIETAKRTRKAGDEAPAVLPSDKTEATPDERRPRALSRPQRLPLPPDNTPVNSLGNVPQLTPQVREMRELRRIGSPLALRQDSRASSRSHSFRVPDLDPIESSESGDSVPGSLSTSPSTSFEGADLLYKHATRLRESVDDRFSGYLLRLAARAAEKQLREQAIAAFPNNDFHEPVDHYIDHDSEDAEMSDFSRHNSSFTQINWELREMQKHQEKLQQQREKEQSNKDAELMSAKGPSGASPWGNPLLALLSEKDASGAAKKVGGWQREIGIKEMRDGARPPMLGSDIKFPRCSSPEPARFDVTQGSHHLRSQMCYLTEQTKPEEPEGLWEPKKSTTAGSRASLWSNAGSRRPSKNGGLWGGFCQGNDLAPPQGPTGLMTPRIEIDNPMEQQMSTILNQLPPSPPPSNSGMASLDQKLQTAQALDEEFNDAFITQVYNYLSLGYPAIGRNFDEELCKISHIPIAELRQDDHLAESRGYIRLGHDENAEKDGITEETCLRWKALRLYIKEWGRQQPLMTAGAHPTENWGVTARKGSWAW